MLSAVEILIERTKTHPEEFEEGQLNKYSKWGDLINNFSPCMTQEEREALAAAMTEAKRTLFNEAVMKRLAGSDKKNDLLEEIAIRSNKPKSILTSAQLTKDALKIIEGEFDKEYSRFTKEYDINTDSYYLKEKK